MITSKEILDEVVRIADENPDFVYQQIPNELGASCKYVHDGQPSCLIGRAFWNLGLIDATLEQQEHENTSGAASMVKYTLHDKVTSTEADREALAHIQDYQDNGMAWGFAVESYKESHA